MGTDGHHSHLRASRSRLTGPKGEGRIVRVQGGHVVKSTGRKDRHSKVCTAKGPRDRRVRLAARTAIQFYDVQDRLGCDRPSEAVDWLIENARAAIDDLAELPPWQPTAMPTASAPSSSHLEDVRDARDPLQAVPAAYGSCSGFLPPSLDGDAIAATIRSFFPNSETTASTSSYDQQTQAEEDLRLSLQSFHDPLLLNQQQSTTDQSIFPTTTPITRSAYDPPYDGDGGTGGYAFAVPIDPALCGGSSPAQQRREPLQSSSRLPIYSTRGWSRWTADAMHQPWSVTSSYAAGLDPCGVFSRLFGPQR